MNKTFKKILSVCCTVVTTLTATLFRSTEVRADNNYRIFFIGDEQVGKTQLVKRIAGNEFEKNYRPTIGVDFEPMATNSGARLRLWERPGGNKSWLECVTALYIGNDVLVYCCSNDQINSQSRENLQESFEIPADSSVMLCITKMDDLHQSDQPSTTDFNQENLKKILTQFREANAGCNILSEILVTSAKNDRYKLCTPETYDSTECKNIYKNLAEDLVNLCKDQQSTRPDVGLLDDLCGASDDADNDGATYHMSLAAKDSRSYGKKPKLKMSRWLGIPASLVCLGLIGGLGCYYEYDRHKTKIAEKKPKGKYIQQEKKRIKQTIR